MVSKEEVAQLATVIAGLAEAVDILKLKLPGLQAAVAQNGRGIKGLEYKALREKGQS